MISSIRGELQALEETSAYLNIGAFTIEVFIPDFVRRQLQGKIGEPIELRTMAYLDGNPQKGGRMTPRLVGFTSKAELAFFELICSVDGLGIKKALGAIVRPFAKWPPPSNSRTPKPSAHSRELALRWPSGLSPSSAAK